MPPPIVARVVELDIYPDPPRLASRCRYAGRTGPLTSGYNRVALPLLLQPHQGFSTHSAHLRFSPTLLIDAEQARDNTFRLRPIDVHRVDVMPQGEGLPLD